MQLQSSNPVLTQDRLWSEWIGKRELEGTLPATATINGVIAKTGILTAIALVGGGIGYAVAMTNPNAPFVSAIAAFVITLGIFFVLRGNPAHARFLGPVYAIVEGFFLGAFTRLADHIVAQQGLEVFGSVGLQAFIITASALLGVLTLYRARIIRPTRTFQAVLMTATGAIMLAYLATFVLSFFGVSMPLISVGAAVQDQGLVGLLGLGINLVILVIASLWLVMDFKLVEDTVEQGSPKVMEWYCGFALIVTLAWIYFEAVKLVLRVATLLNRE